MRRTGHVCVIRHEKQSCVTYILHRIQLNHKCTLIGCKTKWILAGSGQFRRLVVQTYIVQISIKIHRLTHRGTRCEENAVQKQAPEGIQEICVGTHLLSKNSSSMRRALKRAWGGYFRVCPLGSVSTNTLRASRHDSCAFCWTWAR